MTGFVVAADVGGSAIKGVAMAVDGTVLRSATVPTLAAEGPDAVLGRVAALLRDLGAGGPGGPRAAGVAVLGIVDERSGVAVRAANAGWRDTPVRDPLAADLGLPVTVVHDVRAGALAEARLGAARGAGSALFVAVGTGIAAALVLDGTVLPGAHGLAGEIGHLPVVPGGARCGCGGRGCLETVASAAAVARAYAERGGSAMNEMTGAGADTADAAVDAAEVAARARAGDPVAVRVWADAVDHLGAALATCQTLLDPALVVVGGGLAGAGGLLIDPLDAAIRARLTFQRPPRLVPGALGGLAGCLGAGLAAWDAVAVPT